jgi:hypothetical protein
VSFGLTLFASIGMFRPEMVLNQMIGALHDLQRAMRFWWTAGLTVRKPASQSATQRTQLEHTPTCCSGSTRAQLQPPAHACSSVQPQPMQIEVMAAAPEEF